MNEIIGLQHLKGSLESLVNFVDSEFGTPRSLMLELPCDWRCCKDRIITSKYFYKLAEEYEPRGTRIIAGDRNRYVVEPLSPEWFLNFDEQLRKGEWHPETLVEGLKDFSGILGEILRYEIKLILNRLSPAKTQKRNEGLLEAFNEQNPDLTIVGDSHAQYLKSNRPDAHYTYFMIDSPLHHFLHMRDNIFWRTTVYDSLHISRLSKK